MSDNFTGKDLLMYILDNSVPFVRGMSVKETIKEVEKWEQGIMKLIGGSSVGLAGDLLSPLIVRDKNLEED